MGSTQKKAAWQQRKKKIDSIWSINFYWRTLCCIIYIHFPLPLISIFTIFLSLSARIFPLTIHRARPILPATNLFFFFLIFSLCHPPSPACLPVHFNVSLTIFFISYFSLPSTSSPSISTLHLHSHTRTHRGRERRKIVVVVTSTRA